MSLTFRFAHGQSLTSSCHAFADYGSTLYHVNTLPTAVSDWDMPLNYLRGGFECHFDLVTAAHWVGYPHFGDTSLDEIVISNKPEPFKVGTDAYDSDTYGSIYRNFQILGSIVTGKALTFPSTNHESFTRHATFTGKLRSSSTTVPSTTSDVDFFGYTLHSVRMYEKPYMEWKILKALPLLVEPLPHATGAGPYPDLLDVCRELSRFNVEQYFWFGRPFYRKLSSFSYTYSGGSLSIQYHMYVVDLTYNWSWGWDSRIVCNPAPNVRSGPPLVGSTITSDPSGSVVFAYENALTSEPEWFPGYYGPSSDSYSNPWIYPASADVPSTYDLDSDNPIVVTRFSDLHKILRSFRDLVHADWRNITPASLFSSVDAFNDAESQIAPNVLQSLVKIPGIVDSLPDLKEAMSIVSKVVKRELNLLTLREVLDFATSTQLWASFELRPYAGLITQYVPQIASTLHGFGVSRELSVGRGKFSFQLYNELGRESVTITVRSKIVLDASESSLVSSLTGLDALGLLPKASNIWDLLPFTFLVNWFTGVGDAIRRAESSLLLATIPAYFVHSYTITSPITDEELVTMKASSYGSEQPSLRLYYRDVSTHSPIPRESRFQFGTPKGIPFMGTLGSLLYQLIFS